MCHGEGRGRSLEEESLATVTGGAAGPLGCEAGQPPGDTRMLILCDEADPSGDVGITGRWRWPPAWEAAPGKGSRHGGGRNAAGNGNLPLGWQTPMGKGR